METPRQNWETAFEKMSKEGDDKMLLNDILNDENFEEWTQLNIQSYQ